MEFTDRFLYLETSEEVLNVLSEFLTGSDFHSFSRIICGILELDHIIILLTAIVIHVRVWKIETHFDFTIGNKWRGLTDTSISHALRRRFISSAYPSSKIHVGEFPNP